MLSGMRVRGAVGCLLLVLGVAGVLTPAQMSLLQANSDYPDELPDRMLLAWTCFGRGILLQLPGLVVALVTAFFTARPWVSGFVCSLWSVLVALYVWLDISLMAAFDRHASTYLQYLGEPEITRWGGDVEIGAWLWSHAVGWLSIGILGGSALWMGRRLEARKRSAVVLSSLLAIVVVILAVSCLTILGLATPGQRYAFFRTLEIPGLRGMGWTHDSEEIDRLLSTNYREHLDVIRAGAPQPRLEGFSDFTNLPDLVVLVLESFRADALRPRVMPHLWGLPGKGTRFDAHFSASNASHGGMYSIVFSRPPVDYWQVLDARRRPDLIELFSQAGYESLFISSAETRWQMMERYLEPPAFDSMSTHLEGELWQRDTEVVKEIAERLQEQSGRKFILGFLMSTHFPFHAPYEVAKFQPILPMPDGLDPALEADSEALLNRYWNSAHYVDSLIGQLLEQIDLERTLVVITGDHGESIFEDGTLAHSSRLSDIQTHVPLVVAGPGVPRGRVIQGPTSHLDLVEIVLPPLGLKDASRIASPVTTESQREFVPLIGVNMISDLADVALRSDDHRYLIRIEKGAEEVSLLGLLGKNGNLTPRKLEEADARRVTRWFKQFLSRWWSGSFEQSPVQREGSAGLRSPGESNLAHPAAAS